MIDCWSNASGNITYLLCQVTQNDPMIGRSYDFMSGTFSLCITTLPSLVVMDIVVMEICFSFAASPHVTTCLNGRVAKFGSGNITFLICQVNSQYHHVTLLVGSSHGKLPFSQVWWS